MIVFYASGVDITAAVQFGSLSITEQANNRRNTAKFIVNDLTMSEATKVDIYKASKLSSALSAGVSSFVLDSVFSTDFFRPGDRIVLGVRTANEEIVEVDTVTPGTRTIALVSPTKYTHAKGDLAGKKLFSGVTLKNPREEIGKSDVLTYSVECADMSSIFDTHNIVDTYVGMYAREIIGRIAYLFTADDSRGNINDMETLTGIIPSGVAVTPTLDAADKIYKNNSVNLGSSAAGSATYSIPREAFLFDGDFLGGLNDASPYGWKAGTTGGISFENTGVEGGRCMRVTLTAGDYREIQSHFAGYFGTGGYAIKPSTKYVIRGWMKVVGTGTMQYGARFGLLTSNSGGGSAGEAWVDPVISQNSGWTYYEKEFTSSASAVTAHSACNFYNHGSSTFSGDVYFDRFTISEVADFSAMDRIRAWLKIPANVTNWVTGIRVRALSAGGSFYEWNDTVLESPVWSYDSFDFSRATLSGSPSRASIYGVEVTLLATKAIPIGTFKLDHIFASAGGFSIRGVQKGNILFRDVRAQYKKPTTFVENLAKNDGFSWYVDNDRDIQYFASEGRAAPFSIIAPTGKNYGGLKISADITNLKNRQVVRGGIAPSDFTYEQKHVCDGKETSYRLDYPPKTLVIHTSTDNGVTWVPRTVGVENLVGETSVDFLFNFSEKTVRNGGISLLAQGTIIRLVYYPYKDVRVQVKDDASITVMKALLGGDGIFDGAVINDASFRTFDEARARAKAELKAYSNPILTATFQTETEGLSVGQVIRITEPTFGIDEDFVIQRLDKKVKDFTGILSHSVTAGTTLYGLTEFFQYLLKMTGTGDIDTAELVDNVVTIDETLILTDTFSTTKKSNVFYAHSHTGQYSFSLTFTEGGTSNDAYADFCQAS